MSPIAYVLPLVIWLGTLIVCLLCVCIAWRSIFGDRGKGKRRCPKCWYDLAYSPSMTCGECGHTALDERAFTRTRRRPYVALASISICVALVIGVNDQMNQRGMLRHVPSGLLIWSLPITGGMDSKVGREIDNRMAQQKLSPAQGVRLIERCAEGDWLSAPPSKAWVANYGNFISTWRNRFIGDASAETPLLAIPPLVEAKTRAKWPQGVPIVVAVRLEDWWPAGMECRVRATPREVGAGARGGSSGGSRGSANGTGGAAIDSAIGVTMGASNGAQSKAIPSLTFYRGAETRFRPSPFTMYLPPLPAGDHEIVIDFQVDRRRAAAFVRGTGSSSSAGLGAGSGSGSSAAAANPADASLADADAVDENDENNAQAWEPVGAFSSTMKVRIEGDLADMAKPISNQILDGQLAQVFGNAVRWAGGGRSPVRFGINAPATFVPEFNDVAVGVSVQLERHGEVARRLNLWWIGGDNINQETRNYGFEINFENLDLLQQLEDGSIDQDGWQLRVKGDPTLALRAGVAKRFWSGEFTTPINLRMSQSAAPPRMWWTEGDAEEKAKDEVE